MQHSGPLPILLYHKVGYPPAGARIPGQCVAPRLFRRHLAYLCARGYHGLSLTDFTTLPAALPKKPIIITFDDGYRNLYEHAFPALLEFNFTATIFMVTGGIDTDNYWETALGDAAEPMLRRTEILEMHRAGIAFGSHTVHHPHLTHLPPETAREELMHSRQALEELLGEPCRTLAYPYGDWNQSVRNLAAEAGYTIACTTIRAAAGANDDLLALPRLNIRRYNIVPRFAYKLWRLPRGMA